MSLDRPLDDGRVQSTHVAFSTSTVCADTIPYLIYIFKVKRALALHLRHLPDIHEVADKSVPDERGRKTPEFRTSGAKQTETWRG